MRSLFKSIQYAIERGIQIEIVVVLDRPDRATEDYFGRYEDSDIKIKSAGFGDPGLSRNFGINHASGRYVAILDADNLFARNWLYVAFRYLEGKVKEVVAHPEYQVLFENINLVFRQISSADPDFTVSNIIEYNYWDTVCVAKKEIFLRHPYEETTGGGGFGFEDWHWNCQTLADGIEHHVVPNTVHFRRMKKSGSSFSYHVGTSRIIRPSRLFDPEIFSRMLDEERARCKG
jgi:glycosyltransferase involved in cell wall biosynthesis